ncbi:MAG: copper chaperone PCu(A)C [Desertimonas sp.]
MEFEAVLDLAWSAPGPPRATSIVSSGTPPARTATCLVMSRQRRALPILAAAGVLALASCGDDDAEESGAEATAAPAAESTPTSSEVSAETTALTATSDEDDEDDGADGAEALTVSDAWSRQPAEGQSMGVVYATLENEGDETIQLVAASTPVAQSVELHRTEMDDDGQMTMAEEPDGFEIPAGGTLVLEPGGNHLMLMDIDPATFPDDVVEVTLEFDGADPITVEAEVRAIDGSDTMDMGATASTADM